MGFLYHNFLSDLFGMSLNGLAGLVTEYAIAIILLTIFIRMALMPIDIKMRKNQRKMAELGPQMQSLQKRYANDPAQLQKKQRELYKKMGAQPLLGCLPMLLPPVGVWTVSQFQCGRSPSQVGYPSQVWWAVTPPTA